MARTPKSKNVPKPSEDRTSVPRPLDEKPASAHSDSIESGSGRMASANASSLEKAERPPSPPTSSGGMLPLVTALIAFIGVLLAILLNSMLADLREGRAALRNAEEKITAANTAIQQVEKDIEGLKKQVGEWSAHEFSGTCAALKGIEDFNTQTCIFPDGRATLKYDPPFDIQ